MPSSVQDALERHYLPLPIYRANETVERSSAAETEIPKPDFEPCLSNATRIKTLGGGEQASGTASSVLNHLLPDGFFVR
jgi:hypothetical protein